MKVVLAVESVRYPLTGIGRYTWELASRLPQKLGARGIKYLSNDIWMTLDDLAKRIAKDKSHDEVTIKSKLTPLLRKVLKQLPFAKSLYHLVMPIINKSGLNQVNFDLYHGPMYFVPKINKPSIVTVHDLSTLINPAWHPSDRVAHINKLLPDSVTHATYVITVSQAVREEVIRTFSLPPEKVMAVLHGVDPIFSPRNKESLIPLLATYNLRPNSYSLCVATIEPRKNIHRLIDAYRSLPPSILRHWPLVLVGEPGWNSHHLHEKIKAASQEGWLKYLGFIPSSHLPFIYSGARLFVYPSLYEGFGLPVLEALASGIPVITSNCSSLPEVANGTAYLVQPKDTEALNFALEFCLEDENWREKAIAAGLLRAKELSWEASVDNTLEVYKLAVR